MTATITDKTQGPLVLTPGQSLNILAAVDVQDPPGFPGTAGTLIVTLSSDDPSVADLGTLVDTDRYQPGNYDPTTHTFQHFTYQGQMPGTSQSPDQVLAEMLYTAPVSANKTLTLHATVSYTSYPPNNAAPYTVTDAHPIMMYVNSAFGQADGFLVVNTSTGQQSTQPGNAYMGPVAGLGEQYVTLTPDNVNVTALKPNVFIHSGSGEDAIDVSEVNGNNVLDGFTGSNFLVGGTGQDSFFVDDRGSSAPIWSTLANFHSGDAATVWGVTASDFTLQWQDGQGAAGYTGLTLTASEAGKPDARLTLAGFTAADLQSGKLVVSYGTSPDTPGLPGSPYLSIHAS